ncbi:MAG: protein DpdF [Verrucomicrobiota bacterium]
MTPFSILKSGLREGTGEDIPDSPFDELPHERLRLALRSGSGAGPSDLAVLVRHVLRHEGRHGSIPQLSICGNSHPWPPVQMWGLFGCRALEANEGRIVIEAFDWSPSWLRPLHFSKMDASRTAAPETNNGVFHAAEHGEPRHPRLSVANHLVADPGLPDLGVEKYLSHAQAETIRCVMLSPPGCVRLVVLPTGSGKSLVGLSAALAGLAKVGGLTIIVVPTIALAFDQMEQARKHSPGAAIDAWRSGLDPSVSGAIRERIRAGQQRVLYVSPESLVGTLRRDITDAASRGGVSNLIIDEAHLVTMWGASFRPEFQTLTALWRNLRVACPQGRLFKTLLMTATVTPETYADLHRIFHTEDGTEMTTLAAIHLRPEPDYFMAQCHTEEEREQRMLKILRHAPRPAILYVTKVDDAIRWHRWCLSQGWTRTGLVHGECSAQDRENAIIKWRNNASDLMVATSAFGVGMDKGDVRLVLHACVPETVDRFYQEVGRGGRDAKACVSILLWTDEDFRIGRGMSSPKLIGDELGLERWKTLWHSAKPDGELHRLDLRALRPGKQWDSERNIGWNIRTLLMLARAGVLELVNTGTEFSDSDEGAPQIHATVRLWKNSPTSEQTWDEQVGAYRKEAKDAAHRNWTSMAQILDGSQSLIGVLRQTYLVPSAGIHDVPEFPADEVPFPPADLSAAIAPHLAKAVGIYASGTVLVTYRTSGQSRDDLVRKLVETLKLLSAAGIREISLPPSWRSRNSWEVERNPIVEMQMRAPEKFLIVRVPSEDKPFACHPRVPRVSFIPPDHSGQAIHADILAVDRPLHLILVPEECPDPGHMLRRIGDAGFPSIDLQNLLRQLKL